MEDPYLDMEENIQEYSSEGSGGKVRWILSKGLTIGKKMVVTGFVISSAPVILPPLVVISFIGFACSVPYGILLASYACTNKVMSKLLPGSKPPPFWLEYGKVLSTDEEVENGEGELVKDSNELVKENGYEEHVGEYGNEREEGEEVGLKAGDIDMEKEEEEISEDTREMHEMRIELFNKGNDEVDEKGHGGVRKNVQELAKDSNEIVEENGYEEDVGDEIEVEPMKLEVEVIIEGVGEQEEQEPTAEESGDQLPVDEVQAIVVDIEGDEKFTGTSEDLVAPFEVTNMDVGLCQNTDIKEDEELVKETRGLLEKIKEEGMTDKGEKDDRQSMEGNQKVNGNVEEVWMPFEDRIGNARMQKPLGEVENNKHKIPEEKSRVKQIGYAQKAEVMPKERSSEEMVGGLLEKKDVTSNNPGEEKPIVGINEANKVGSNRNEEQKPGLDKPSILQARVEAKDNIANNAKQNNWVNREKENLVSSNEDAREIADESGFDLFDKRDAASHQVHADNDAVQGNEQSSSYVSPDVDFTALPIFAGPKRNEAGVSSQEDSGIASSKALYSEEKVWEQIDAMRRIVGYTAAPKATSIEELKALYLFTGVEPPSMFKNPSDLVEVNHKLKFLMSIVGVK